MKVYVSKETKKEDMKSTASAFLTVGIAGFLLLFLFAAGILPLHVADYMKVMLSIVMGIMFFIFLLVGIHSLRQYQTLKRQSVQEQDVETTVKNWFLDHVSREDLDCSGADNDSLYFERYARMESLIRGQFPNLEESFLDHLIEDLYSDFFEENQK